MSRNKRIALAFLILVGSAEIALARSTLLLGCSLAALAAWHCRFSEAAAGRRPSRPRIVADLHCEVGERGDHPDAACEVADVA